MRRHIKPRGFQPTKGRKVDKKTQKVAIQTK